MTTLFSSSTILKNSSERNVLSDICIANVEALASGESGGQPMDLEVYDYEGNPIMSLL